MSSYNQSCSSNGHDVEGRENPKVVGIPPATNNAYPMMSMEHRQQAASGTMLDHIETAGQSGYQFYHGERDVPYMGKSEIYVTRNEPLTKPNRTNRLVPVHGIAPLHPRLQQISGTYTPLQRWEQETFREQPWHGIARELMVDSIENETTGDEDKEYIATNPRTDERRRDAAKTTAENN